uniref:Uncharacterized protein n=1 Tax=Quercus lobata TaxID=97700 RepID=A0A7N2LVG0_QUELO
MRGVWLYPSPICGLVLQQLADDESSSAARVYSELLHRVESFLVSESEDDEDKAYRVLLVIVINIAVVAFLAFTQCNMTRPLKDMAKCPLALKKVGGKGEDEELVE